MAENDKTFPNASVGRDRRARRELTDNSASRP